MRTKPSFILSATFIVLLVACSPGNPSITVSPSKAAPTITSAPAIPTQTDTQAPPTASPTTTPTPEPSLVPTTTNVPPTATLVSGAGQPLRIAYTRGGDVYFWTEGQGSVALTDTHDVVALKVSDDGTLVAFQRQDTVDYYFMELWVVNTAGLPDPRLLVSHTDLMEITPPDPESYIKGAGLLNFTWRPNTHEVAYSTYVLLVGVGSSLNHDLRLVDADTQERTTLLDTGQGGIYYYSPDGNQIALSNPESISLINADGSNRRPQVLTYPSVITYSEYEYHPHPTWSADSRFLLVAIPPHDPLAEPFPPTALWRIPGSGSPADLLRNIEAIPFTWPNNCFSPDARLIAYVKTIGAREENQRELRIGALDGSSEATYDQGESLEFIGWSPDSQHFFYAIHHDPGKGVYLGDTNGQPILFSNDPDTFTEIQWVDGSRFAYLENNGTEWELKISSVDSKDLSLVDVLPDSSSVLEVVRVGE